MISFEDVIVNLDTSGGRSLRVSAIFQRGDFVLIVGPNGSGKTSLLDLIAGVRRPVRGLMTRIPPEHTVAYAVQEPHSSLMPWRSVLSNILLPSRLACTSENQEVQARSLLKQFGLLHRAHDFPYHLSGGEKQAINLIRTICTPAAIRLFDEITASLHSSFKRVAREVLPTASGKTTTFVVSHDVSDLVMPFNRFLSIKNDAVLEVSRPSAEEMMSHV